MPDLSALVTRGAAIKAEQAALKLELDQIHAVLLKAGAGEYTGSNGASVKVIQPMAKFAPDAEAVEQARELVGDEVFKKIFDRSVVYTAKKAARHIAAALLTPAKLEKFIALCEVPATAFPLWPK